MSTSTTSLNILSKYFTGTFYNGIPFTNPVVTIYYNSFTYEVMSVIPFDHKEAISEVKTFSDYIILISDADKKFEYTEDLRIGIIYIDPKAQTNTESINIVRLPVRQRGVNSKERSTLLTSYVRDVYMPFWIKSNSNHSEDDKPAGSNDPAVAKARIEEAIQSYCSQNNLTRSEITSYGQFIDHIAPDIFKYKMTVADEMQLRKEAEMLDTKVECYPKVLLKAIVTLELVK